MSFLSQIFGTKSNRFIAKMQATVDSIASFEPKMMSLSDAEFPLKTRELQERLVNGETVDQLLPEAFALVREASRRTLGLRHYDEQLIGGITLHKGSIAEMRTGEGKTLVATLPVYLNALAGLGVHVVTVNDYLARRDAVWMGQVYSFLGLSVGVINSQNTSFLYKKPENIEGDAQAAYKVDYDYLVPVSRKEAYLADITYGTNNEFGFDFLRDNLVTTQDQLVQRGHPFAIVDEIDSILIDESRTPLIISSESSDSDELYITFARIASELSKDTDYTVDEKRRAIQLTDLGITKAEEKLGIENIYTEKGIKYVHHLETAVKAKALYLRDKEYVVQKDEIIIVDSFTGRLQPGRRWSEGLHQAIEAKEGVKIQKETRAVASITFQNYFRFYAKLAGMTGTAETSKEEFYKVYGLEVQPIPTHRPIRRIDQPDLIFQSEKGKFRALAKKVKELQQKGQPVLIGTVSIEKNELLSLYLANEGVLHTVLNAKNHEREGEIVANAGKKGSVVVATNMAGRGVDIKLGGALATEALSEEVRQLGGLFVIGTERHEARRIDNQLRGRSGRQGDPGETQFYVSLEDDLMRVFGSDRIKTMMGTFNIPDDMPLQHSIVSKSLESAQARIEGFNFDSRKHTLEYDDVMNHQRNTLYARRRKLLLGEREVLDELIAQIIAVSPDFIGVVSERKSLVGEDAFYEAVRRSALYINDSLWVEHLETMEYLRSSVSLRAYGQHEPLIEYRKEGLRLFKELEQTFFAEVENLIRTMNTDAKSAPPVEAVPLSVVAEQEMHQTGTIDTEETKFLADAPAMDYQKPGRNDSCPCGSGKKFKKCHGA